MSGANMQSLTFMTFVVPEKIQMLTFLTTKTLDRSKTC